MDFWSDARAEVGFLACLWVRTVLENSTCMAYLWLLALLEESLLTLLAL